MNTLLTEIGLEVEVYFDYWSGWPEALCAENGYPGGGDEIEITGVFIYLGKVECREDISSFLPESILNDIESQCWQQLASDAQDAADARGEYLRDQKLDLENAR